MFDFFKKGKTHKVRSLTRAEQLMAGDIIVLKERLSLPAELRGLQFEVTGVGTYEYSDGTEKELTLRSVENKTYYMSVDENDGDPMLCFSVKIPRKVVETLFDPDAFASLWEPGYVSLEVQRIPEKYKDWVLESTYVQEVLEEEGYYYDRDCSDNPPSSLQDDDGDEFRYHACVSDQDANYSMTVEIWADGETDVFLQVSTPLDVISEMWPHGDG